jgi:hypothetical protein
MTDSDPSPPACSTVAPTHWLHAWSELSHKSQSPEAWTSSIIEHDHNRRGAKRSHFPEVPIANDEDNDWLVVQPKPDQLGPSLRECDNVHMDFFRPWAYLVLESYNGAWKPTQAVIDEWNRGKERLGEIERERDIERRIEFEREALDDLDASIRAEQLRVPVERGLGSTLASGRAGPEYSQRLRECLQDIVLLFIRHPM